MVIQPAFMHYVHTTWLHINSQRSLFRTTISKTLPRDSNALVNTVEGLRPRPS